MSKDVIIVLAGGVFHDGSLPDMPKLRTEKGAELFKKGMAPRMIMSGHWGFWSEDTPAKTEAEAMKEYAMGLGVPKNVILKEEESKDTIGNAYFSKVNFLEPNNWKKVIIVTSDYHLKRSKFLFQAILGPEYDIDFVGVHGNLPEEEFQKRMEKERKTLKAIIPWFNDLKPITDQKIKDFLYTKHPGYAANPEITKEQLRKILGRE